MVDGETGPGVEVGAAAAADDDDDDDAGAAFGGAGAAPEAFPIVNSYETNAVNMDVEN